MEWGLRHKLGSLIGGYSKVFEINLRTLRTTAPRGMVAGGRLAVIIVAIVAA
jgi:hypothetical protein